MEKAKTLQEKLGFKDEDLISDKHDEIILWLFDNSLEVVRKLFKDKGEVDENTIKISKVSFEYPVINSFRTNKNIIGFIDAVIYFSYQKNNETIHYSIAVEVKSYIKSIGELLRQINLYKEFTKNYFVVISPDDRFIKILESEDIRFYKYKPVL